MEETLTSWSNLHQGGTSEGHLLDPGQERSSQDLQPFDRSWRYHIRARELCLARSPKLALLFREL